MLSKQKSFKCDNQLITWLTVITRPAGSCNLVTLKTNFAQYKNFVGMNFLWCFGRYLCEMKQNYKLDTAQLFYYIWNTQKMCHQSQPSSLIVCVLRKTMRFLSSMFVFQLFWDQLENSISNKYHIWTGSFQNELQVCVLRKTMRFLFSTLVFHVFYYQLENSNSHKYHIGTDSMNW